MLTALWDQYNTLLAEICLWLMLKHSTDIETCIVKNELRMKNVSIWNIEIYNNISISGKMRFYKNLWPVAFRILEPIFI